jgi:SAM-dependent methyltransferase
MSIPPDKCASERSRACGTRARDTIEMSVTALSYAMMKSLRRGNALPREARMIEMGESNWYGDVPLSQLAADIRQIESDHAVREQHIAELRSLRSEDPRAAYDVAKVFFRGIAGCSSIASIDPGEPHSTYKFDLNEQVPLTETFDLVINYGTAEHVFDVRRFYQTVHELTRPGGIMIHSGPMCGWVEHGFYTFQSTFFIDLAAANGYEILAAVVGELKPLRLITLTHREHVIELAQKGELPKNALIEVALRKPADARAFKVPMQGIYAGALSEAGQAAWITLR